MIKTLSSRGGARSASAQTSVHCEVGCSGAAAAPLDCRTAVAVLAASAVSADLPARLPRRMKVGLGLCSASAEK